MGKIFKALKKAAKENGVKLTQPSATNVVQPERETAEPQANAKPVEKSSHQHSALGREIRDKAPVEPPAGRDTTAPKDQRPANDPSPSSADSTDTSIEHRPANKLGQTGGHENKYPEKEPSEVPVDSRSFAKTNMGRKTDAANISLVKSEASEPQSQIKHLITEPVTGEIKKGEAGVRQTEYKKRVEVRYSRTKIQTNDPVKLKNNKVLAVFEDFETTNQFKMLRTQVLRKLKSIGGNSILVTSANPYEGKTFTSINLGVSIAKEFDRTVLIIDADIRRPTQKHTDFSTEFFSLKVEKGLTDYLEGEADIEEILINPGIDKLTLIPGGMPVDNSPELLNSAKMEEMMVEIKSRYPSDRLVIVDGPALLHFPDAMILYRYVDGVLPVVEAEKTSTEDLKKMMNQLKDVNILGVVLNKNKG